MDIDDQIRNFFPPAPSMSHSSPVLGICFSIYALMMRFLLQISSVQNRPEESKQNLMNAAFSLVHVLGDASVLHTSFKDQIHAPAITAEMSDDLYRHFTAYDVLHEKSILLEKFTEIIDSTEQVSMVDWNENQSQKLKQVQKALINIKRHLEFG